MGNQDNPQDRDNQDKETMCECTQRFRTQTMSTAIFSHPACQRHEMGASHPESPARLQAIDDQLIASRIDSLLERREAPAVQIDSLLRVHDVGAIALVRDNLPGAGRRYHDIDGDTRLNAHSWDAALHAAGAAVAATDAVLGGEFENAFCAVRPPGHHARPSGAMGFCLFNNVAVAALHALEVHGLERVAIVDFDVHHGNGTEEALAGDERVLMVSFFQHPFYPYSGALENAAGPRAANMLNVPVPAYTKGDAVRELVQRDWLPALERFRPQMLFISAGFDAHREDDLAQLGLVEADYAWLTAQVMEVARKHASGRVVSCLEGGYNLSALGRSVAAHVKVLAGLE